MTNFILAGLGAAFGGIIRGLLGKLNPKHSKFPKGTFAANVIGSVLIGMFVALYLNKQMPSYADLFLVTGFCGGLTTFSTFSFETVDLFLHKKKGIALSYWLISLGSSLVAVGVAFFLVTLFI